MKDLNLTIDETIQVLKRTNLPTVITEGRDDYTVFRFLEDEFNGLEISVLPVGGKAAVLEIFRRKVELSVAPLFIMDQDLWVIFGVPEEYSVAEDVILTSGFSIENDIYTDASLENLLSTREKRQFNEELNEICLWFTCMVERIKSGAHVTLRTNPHQILSGPNRTMSEEFKKTVCYTEPDQSLYQKIRSRYFLLLRGKTLLSLLSQHCSRPKRVAKHSFSALLEFGAASKGPNLSRVVAKISDFFGLGSRLPN